MYTPDLTGARWRKSSRSNPHANECVEAAHLPEVIAMRDSKNPHGPALFMALSEWDAFRAAVKSGRLQLT